MRVLLVNRWYPPHTGFGGIAVYDQYLARALSNLGQRVTVLAARWSMDVPSIQQDENVRVMRLFASEWPRIKRLPILGRYIRPLQQYLYSLEVSRAIARMTGSDRPDVIEFAEVNAEAYHYLRRKSRIPAVVRCHTPTFVLQQYYSTNEMNYDTLFTTHMEKFCISHADALTAPSMDMANLIEKSCNLNDKRIAVIPNPLDIHSFSSAESKEPIASEEITILHVGRLDRIKGIEVLIQAAPEVIKQMPNARFVLLGGGPAEYTNKIQQMISKFGLKQNQFEIQGDVSHNDLIGWYQKADIAVIPTLNYESFSYTVAQAMAARLPVVASHTGGIPETTGTEGAAILTEPGNPQQLAEALITLCKSPQLRQAMGQAGLSRARSYFSSEVVAEKTLYLYKSLVSKKNNQ